MSGWDVSDADMPNIPGSQRADVPELPDGALDGRSGCRAAAGSRASGRAQRGAAGWRTGRARAGPGRIPPSGRQGSPCPSIRTPEAPPAHLASYRQGRRGRGRRGRRCPGRRRRSRLHQYPARARPAVRAQRDRRAVAAAQPPSWHPAGHPGPHGCRRPGRHRPGGVRAVHRLRPREGAWHGIAEGDGVPQPGGGSRRRGQDRRLLRSGAPPGQLAVQPAGLGPDPPGRPALLTPHREAIVTAHPTPDRPALLRARHALDPAG